MKKILITALFFLFFFSFQKVFADSKSFEISSQSSYNIDNSGYSKVFQKIKIKNTTDFIYAPAYTVSLGLSDVKNIKVYNEEGSIPFNLNKTGDLTTVEINFNKRVTGVGKQNEFNFTFESNSIAKKMGNVWEINIPGISDPDSFSNYDVLLTAPDSFGFPSVIKPHKIFQKKGDYLFTKNDIGKSGIYMIFNDKQFYNFKINYHISNSNLFPIKTEIALPLSTNYQEVIINTIEPKPSNVYEDEDGNWLAVYSLTPQKKQDIVVKGVIQVNTNPKEEILTEKERKAYLKEQKYWEINDKEIKALSMSLKNPKNIYEYVVKKLTYNYDKVTGDNERLGAKKVLSEPNRSVCLEFTDLFIAIARAAEIPARSVEGYAFTQNSKLKSLSQVKDVLHSWPEYYDDEKKTWVMIDPTWGNTTGGIDYFDSFDLEHIAFVIKGKDSNYPIPGGGYKFNSNSKDVEITFGNISDFEIEKNFEIADTFQDFYLSGFPIESKIIVKNLGNSIIRNKQIEVLSNLSQGQIFSINSIPPYGYKDFSIKFPKTQILTNQEYEVKILVDGKIYEKNIRVGLFPDKILIIIGGGILSAIAVIFIIARKIWRVHF